MQWIEHREIISRRDFGVTAVKPIKVTKPAGWWGARLHWHDAMEIMRMVNGDMKIGFGENTTVLHPGEIYIIPPNTLHSAWTLDKPIVYEVIVFDVRYFYNETDASKAYLEPLFEGKVQTDIKSGDKELVECFDRIYKNALENENALETAALVYGLIDMLYKKSIARFAMETQTENAIRQSINYMEEHYADPITTESLAKMFGYSASHFCRKFKKVTWLTPNSYLKVFRLERSITYLSNRKLSIDEVARRCGFTDANYFARCFKARFGVPPTKFRK